MADRSVDFTPQLRTLMKQAEISSFNQLSQTSGVPRSQLVKLRRGDLERIPLGSFAALAQVLNVSIVQIFETFEVMETQDKRSDKLSKPGEGSLESPSLDLEALRRQWQRAGLDILESLILQLPTAAFAAKNHPTAPAVKLLPLLNPLNQLLDSWEVEAIGQVGEHIAFDPQCHQWMGEASMPDRESLVKVRYVGYRHGDRLLHRAKVGPL